MVVPEAVLEAHRHIWQQTADDCLAEVTFVGSVDAEHSLPLFGDYDGMRSSARTLFWRVQPLSNLVQLL